MMNNWRMPSMPSMYQGYRATFPQGPNRPIYQKQQDLQPMMQQMRQMMGPQMQTRSLYGPAPNAQPQPDIEEFLRQIMAMMRMRYSGQW